MCILFSLFASVVIADPCDEDVLMVYDLYQKHSERAPVDLDELISVARRARACYAESEESWIADRQAWLLVRECVALTARRRDSECIDAIDDHLSRLGDFTDRRQLAWLYVRRGESSSMLVRHGETVASFSKAIQLGEDLDLGHRLDHLLHAGIAYRRLNDNESARRVYEQVMQIASPHIDTDARIALAYARAAYRLSHVKLHYARRGEDRSQHAHDEGLALLDAAIPLFTRYGPQDQLVYAREAQFRYALAQGDLQAAELRLEQAETAAAGLDDPYVWEALLTARADLAWRMGDTSRAIDLVEEALAAVRPIPQYRRRRGLYNRLGWWSEAAGDRGTAIGWFWKSIRETEQRRTALGSSDWSLIAFSELQFPYRNLARLHLSDGDAEQALHVLERGRARYLQDARYLSRLRGGIPRLERQELEGIESELLNLRSRLAESGVTNEERVELRNEEYLLAWRRSRILQPDTALVVPRLSELQEHLARENRHFVTYLLGDSDDDDSSFALVVGPEHVHAVTLPASKSDIENLLAGLHNETDERSISLQTLHELYLALFDPLLHHIPEGAPVTVVPDGPLQLLPFGMLVTQPVGAYDYRGADYLIRRNPFSSELSAALLLEPRREAGFQYDLLALGRSVFGTDSFSLDEVYLRTDRHPLPNLPHVEEELTFLRRLVRRGLFALNQEATAEFLQENMAHSRIVHLATHSVVNPASAGHSFVQLHPGDESLPERAGTFFMHELQGHYLPSELVVLSACETALGRIFSGEGMTGLQYAFRASGASATLATMWGVDDRAITFLMKQFYGNLRKGMPKDRALQQAQTAYLAAHDGLLVNPFFWAAPIVFGDPGPVKIASPRFLAPGLSTVMAIVAVAFLTGVIVLILLRRRGRLTVRFSALG